MRHWAIVRFFALKKAVELTGIKNIFELASGLSPAGLLWARDPTVRYLETDLPAMMAEKERIAVEFGSELMVGLFLTSLDVFDVARMHLLADDFFLGCPVAITHEGLLPYFTHQEKYQLAKNIASVLTKHGGVWITTDISLKENFGRAFQTSPYSKRIHEILTEATGRDMAELAFSSFDEAEDLFRSAGFSVERHTQLELVPGLLTAEELSRSKNLAFQQVWTMRLK